MRLLIVDDDFQIREGMRNGIDWKELGVTEVDSCANGLEAMELFYEKNPEIIVADIQMPGMNGLEMMQQIRKSGSKTRVIFISAYSNFEYCRQALQMGASDYILKPIQMKEFMDVIRKNIQLIKSENSKNEQYRRVILEKMTRDLYFFHKEGVEGKDVCRYFSENFAFVEEGSNFITVLVRMDKNEIVSIDQIREIGRQLSENEQDFVWLPMSGEGVGIIEGSHSALLSVYQQNEAAQMIRNWNQKYASEYGTISAGISQNHGKNEFYKGYQMAEQALEYRFYEGDASIILCPVKEMKEHIPDSILKYAEQNSKKTVGFSQKEDLEYLKRLEMMFYQEPVKPELFKSFFMDTYWKISMNYGIQEPVSELKDSIEKSIFARECVDNIIDYYNTHIWEKIGIYGMKETNYSQTVQMAVAYIKKHFQEQITVEQVAKIVGKSANYFSSVFKKETGYTFTSYITRMRMERAKWLLLHTNKQISEISEEVGCMDYIYFSQLFRQQFGCSASKMRKRNRSSEIGQS